MKELKYIVEDNEVIELFGRQSFSTKESAILELVKNAYDAKATNLYIDIQYNDNKKCITIIDDGEGMDSNDIETRWVRVGVSDKDYEFEDGEGNTRIYSGQKGVGRFALARLGGDIILESKKMESESIIWKTNWAYNFYEIVEENDFKGTKIIITDLRDKWTSRDFVKLVDYLKRTSKSDHFSMHLKYNDDENIEIKNVFEDSKIGLNYSQKIIMKYTADNLSLNIKIVSDEFNEEVMQITGKSITSFEKTIDLGELDDIKYDLEKTPETILEEMKLLGDFYCEFYFSLDTVSDEDVSRFNYKYKTISERYKTGIILYRNSFSISSYDGKKDWLELNKRVRQSPAAASHPSGAWRVRSNQISGLVNIDKKGNSNLKDLANRQGLEENDFYDLFIQIIVLGISEFEWFRQDIVRKISSVNDDTADVPNKLFVDELLENPKILLNMTQEKIKNIITKIKIEKKEKKKKETQQKEILDSLYYDIRMLNSLSTIGLKSSSIAHELGNDKNFLYEFHENVSSALIEKGVWNDLKSSKEFSKNVPKLLDKNEKISKKLIRFLETNLELIQLDIFDKKKMNFNEILLEIKNRWETDYGFIDINIEEIGAPMDILFYEDILNGILIT